MDCYIVEFEQNGENRAVYGKQQLKKLEQRLNVKGLDEPSFVMQKDKIIGLGLSTMHHDIQWDKSSTSYNTWLNFSISCFSSSVKPSVPFPCMNISKAVYRLGLAMVQANPFSVSQ